MSQKCIPMAMLIRVRVLPVDMVEMSIGNSCREYGKTRDAKSVAAVSMSQPRPVGIPRDRLST